MPTPRRGLLLASIHDVSPRFESEVDRLLALLQSHVGKRLAMLVVPNHWGDAPIIPGSAFASRLRGWADSGVEMFLHGYFHRDDTRHARIRSRLKASLMTASEGEFLGLTTSDAVRRINEGRTLVEDVIGRPIDGFVAPAWLYGSGALAALSEAAVPIAEDHIRVWSPRTRRQLARGPVITWASRTRLRLASSLAAAAVLRHAPIKVLRVGVHPPDVNQPAIVRSIGKTLTAATTTRRPAAYADLLDSVTQNLSTNVTAGFFERVG
jgi:predicted deacetylase